MFISTEELARINQRIADLEHEVTMLKSKDDNVIYEYPYRDIFLYGTGLYNKKYEHKVTDIIQKILSHLSLEIKTTKQSDSVQLVSTAPISKAEFVKKVNIKNGASKRTPFKEAK